MISIRQAVIVEGKYDKIRLSSLLDTLILTTDGFAIFRDTELIRSHLTGSIPKEQIRNAYIPDVYGKEKRKTAAGKEGKLGVEGMDSQTLLQALERAGVFCENAPPRERTITKADLFTDGLSGGESSRQKRLLLCRALGLPERLSQNALLEVLNSLYSYEEYRQAVDALATESL